MIRRCSGQARYCSRYLRKLAFITGGRCPLKEKSSRDRVGGIGEIERAFAFDGSKRVNRNREHVTKGIETPCGHSAEIDRRELGSTAASKT